MSQQNKRTLFVVFAMAIFTLTIFLFSQNSTVPWKEYVDLRIDDLQNQLNRRAETISNETEKALASLNERLSVMNEFRATINDTQSRFVTNEAANKMQEDIRELRSIADVAKGAATQGQFLISMIASFIGMIGGIMGIILSWKKFKR